MDRGIEPKRKVRILRLLSLASFGVGFLTYLQLAFPSKNFFWEVIWLFFIGLVELIAEPLWKKIKIWKRLLGILGVAAIGFTLILWLIRLTKQYGINQDYAASAPWFLMGFVFLVWSLLIRNDTLPE